MYAASAANGILWCIAVIVALPTTSDLTAKAGMISLTEKQRTMLLQSYVPMLVVSSTMMVDMGWRSYKGVVAGLKSTKVVKAKSM